MDELIIKEEKIEVDLPNKQTSGCESGYGKAIVPRK
jgi:hypothetical protein